MNVSMQNLFKGVAAKYLSEVDANPNSSNQHEIGGLVRVGFKEHLGEPNGSEVFKFNSKMMYLNDENETPEIIEDTLSWYNSRAGNPKRSAEYRLYYKSNSVTQQMNAGDFFLIAQLNTKDLLFIACPANSTHEAQLRNLFGLLSIQDHFSAGTLSSNDLSIPLIYLLEALGAKVQLEQEDYLDKLLDKFGSEQFPNTTEFSSFARNMSTVEVSESADICILEWMKTEEVLFRTYEKHLVSQKLNEGFGTEDEQVDNFISYSLSVQNRRKARAGFAFEKHLSYLFNHHQLKFEQGTSKLTTENKKKPDFLFPSFKDYHDSNFNAQKLRLLGAKTSCKDRWRQVLAEGQRISKKHLITLEPSISRNQIDEMKSHNLQLVIPADIQTTYDSSDQSWLINLDEFIDEIKHTQQT